MKLNLKIDCDAVDQIVCCALEQSIALNKEQLKALKSKKKLTKWQQEDVADMTKTLEALTVAFDYFGGNLK